MLVRNEFFTNFNAEKPRSHEQEVTCRVGLGLSKQDIPSFLFIAGHKAHVRYPGQPRTCFRCGRPDRARAKGCPNKKCGRCLRLGHDTSASKEKLCAHSVEGGTCLSRLSLLLCLYDKEWGSSKVPSSDALLPRRKLHARRGTGEDAPSEPGSPSPVVAVGPHRLPTREGQRSPPASPINSSSSVPSPPPVSPDPEALSDGDSGDSVIIEPKRATGTSWYDEMGEPS
ncbi:hypothetical protein BSL78_24434 [Apostichopus japonicus]|uniref:CCHC-type domain-containing protein n=1 Tax=Stichopus japonicus TaxID=307972 RepID=A0A2G8JSN1_STIJA|nr:hypothetical protein BSL78_24434 [Apostichopus japonicus]